MAMDKAVATAREAVADAADGVPLASPSATHPLGASGADIPDD